MKRIALAVVAVGLFAFVATPALADNQPSSRDIQAAVDTYLASAQQDATLVGGPGSAGYDSGFWIRGGDFSLHINLTLQARYEWFAFDDDEEVTRVAPEAGAALLAGADFPGGQLSGFSLPRSVLKFSGTAPCNVRYYVEMDFGHDGSHLLGLPITPPLYILGTAANAGVFLNQWYNFDNTREAWIEWGCSEALNFRMGQIKTPGTRQLMVPPELQQFVDISMASAVIGNLIPGYTDRNRDFGAMIHGVLGCNQEFQYMLAVTNGDGGDSLRNVLNPLTDDNVALSGRLNWAFLNRIGYQEGATRQSTCDWYGEIGAWAHYYASRIDRPHTAFGDRLSLGGDLALGYGGWSFTGAVSYFDFSNSDIGVLDETWLIWLVQMGYHFPGTAWELAGRWSHYDRDIDTGLAEPSTDEFAFGVNYYLNGHGNKLSADVSFISADADNGAGGGYYDTYAGVPLGFGSNGDSMLLRFQWQLAL